MATGGLPGAAAGGSIGGMMSSQLGAQDANQESLQTPAKVVTGKTECEGLIIRPKSKTLRPLDSTLLAVNGGASTSSTSSATAQNTNAGMGTAFSDAVNSAIVVRDMKIKMRSLKSLSTILQDTENKSYASSTENQQRATAKDIEQKPIQTKS